MLNFFYFPFHYSFYIIIILHTLKFVYTLLFLFIVLSFDSKLLPSQTNFLSCLQEVEKSVSFLLNTDVYTLSSLPRVIEMKDGNKCHLPVFIDFLQQFLYELTVSLIKIVVLLLFLVVEIDVLLLKEIKDTIEKTKTFERRFEYVDNTRLRRCDLLNPLTNSSVD